MSSVQRGGCGNSAAALAKPRCISVQEANAEAMMSRSWLVPGVQFFFFAIGGLLSARARQARARAPHYLTQAGLSLARSTLQSPPMSTSRMSCSHVAEGLGEVAQLLDPELVGVPTSGQVANRQTHTHTHPPSGSRGNAAVHHAAILTSATASCHHFLIAMPVPLGSRSLAIHAKEGDGIVASPRCPGIDASCMKANS